MTANAKLPPIEILPSILSARMGHLADDCRRAMDAGADGLHVDVMDGHFVPNITMGPDIVRAVREACPGAYLHVHLMIDRPDVYAPRFAAAGADTILFHVEAPCDLHAAFDAVRAAGKRAGITLNPETPVDALAPWAPLADEILVMTVHPGFGGQSFIEDGLSKIAEIHRRWPAIPISVDGGVADVTGVRCAAAGATILIAGSYLFKAKIPMSAAIDGLREGAFAAAAFAARDPNALAAVKERLEAAIGDAKKTIAAARKENLP